MMLLCRINDLKNIVPRTTLCLMYLFLAWSQLSYCILAWSRVVLTVIKRLEAVQHRLVRNIYDTSSVRVYQSGKILPFKETYTFFTMVKLFNIIIKIDDSSYFNERLRDLQTNHLYSTRFVNQNNIDASLYSGLKCQNSFLYKSIGLWHNLPIKIKNCRCISIFKYRHTFYLLKLY